MSDAHQSIISGLDSWDLYPHLDQSINTGSKMMGLLKLRQILKELQLKATCYICCRLAARSSWRRTLSVYLWQHIICVYCRTLIIFCWSVNTFV